MLDLTLIINGQSKHFRRDASEKYVRDSMRDTKYFVRVVN